MKRERVQFGQVDEEYGYQDEVRTGTLSKTQRKHSIDPPQLVVHIKESIQELRKLLEEKRAIEAGYVSSISPTIPLNFRFKSIMELSQAVRSKFLFGSPTTTSNHRTHMTQVKSATLHQEQTMFSVEDSKASYCNGHGNGHLHHPEGRNGVDETDSKPQPLIHEPEEIQRISALIKNYNENQSELDRAKGEIAKLEKQINDLQEARTMLELEKAKLTKVTPVRPNNYELATKSTSSSFSSKLSTDATSKNSLRRSRSSLKLVKKASGRVFYGILEACF